MTKDKIMDLDKNRKYINELFEVVPVDSILVVYSNGEIKRINCPFYALVIRENVKGLEFGSIVIINRVRMSLIHLVEIYVVNEKAYFYYNFHFLKK